MVSEPKDYERVTNDPADEHATIMQPSKARGKGVAMEGTRTPHVDEAMRLEARFGHRFGAWEPEDGWGSIVTTCLDCDELAAIDLGAEPYLFGRAFRVKCGAESKAGVRCHEWDRAVNSPVTVSFEGIAQ